MALSVNQEVDDLRISDIPRPRVAVAGLGELAIHAWEEASSSRDWSTVKT